MAQPHIQVILGDDSIPTHLDSALGRSSATTSFRPLSEALRTGVSKNVDAVVIVVPEDTHPLNDGLRVLFERMAEHPRATLIVKPSGSTISPIKHPDSLPVIFGSTSNEDELASRLETMLAMRKSLESLHNNAVKNQKSERTLANHYATQLKLASKVQRDFMPRVLPPMGCAHFSTIFKPADFVSGDIYDVQRLDDDHVGLALADATGHGIPAALLTVFIKRALRGQSVHNGQTEILSPDVVLKQLNNDILETDIAECRFVAAMYAVLNTKTLEMKIARGGTPYPIIRRGTGEANVIRSEGSVIGILPEAEFEVVTIQLEPKDDVVLFTDGLESLLTPQVSTQAIAEAFTRAAEMVRTGDRVIHSQLANTAKQNASTTTVVAAAPAMSKDSGGSPDEEITQTSWFEMLKTEGTAPALDDLILRHDALRRIGHSLDDLTVLSVEIAG